MQRLLEKKGADSEGGMDEIVTLSGPKVVNAGLTPEAKQQIVNVINSRCQQVRALYVVSSNGINATMRIDLIGQLGVISPYSGAKVPLAQIGSFMETRIEENKEVMVPLNDPVVVLELNSDDVLNIFSDLRSPNIQDHSRLFDAIIGFVEHLSVQNEQLQGEFKIEFQGYV